VTSPPSREGSISRLVAYAYFTARIEGQLGYYLPTAYASFDASSDETVFFVAVINYPGRPYVLRGRLRRPDGAQHAEFTRSIPDASLAGGTTYFTSEAFPVADLRAFPGRWQLDLFMEDERVGTYFFLLGRRP
jgi:hypothetical protein